MTWTDQTKLHLKKYGYLIFFLLALLPVFAHGFNRFFGHNDAFAWAGPVIVFGVIPVLDWLLGPDPTNPNESDVMPMSAERYYMLLTLACVPMVFGVLAFGGWVFATWPLSWIGKIGWLFSCGIVGGALGITVAHELVHKDSRLEKWAGGLLLSFVCYGGFKIEHVRGHHVNVSTPADASSSRYNQSLYEFLPQAYVRNFLNAWRLEAKEMQRHGRSLLSWHNELLWWYGLSAIWCALTTWAWGLAGFVYFVGMSFSAFTLLEIVNYIEHYGLHRRQLENGRYERITHEHSWNSNYLLTNLFLFHLQRHSDHHAHAKRRYQVLRHFPDSPQLPAGYATMVVLALIPPLWFKIMNPRVDAYYADDLLDLNVGLA